MYKAYRIHVIKIKDIAIFIVWAIIGILTVWTIYWGIKSKNINTTVAKKQLPIYYVQTDEKVVSITFDCAWGDSDIGDILKTLRDNDIKASFFIVGTWAERYPQTAKWIADEGHDIASHGYGHFRMSTLSKDKIREDILKSEKVLFEITGQKIELFRPPYGDYNDDVIIIARSEGYYPIQWNIDSLDWKKNMGRQEILNRVVNNVKPGSIILFHNDTLHTAKLLPEIIQNLKQKGYGFLPVSKLIIRENYMIDFDGAQKKNP